MAQNNNFSVESYYSGPELAYIKDIIGLEINDNVIYSSLLGELSNRRIGCASVKGRSDVAGSNKKPWGQKGLGRARAGSVKSPLWRGGGVIFGPRPRSYYSKVPSRVKSCAFVAVFAKFFQQGRIRIVDSLNLKDGKVKEIAQWFRQVDVEGLVDESSVSILSDAKFYKVMRKYRFSIISSEYNFMLKRSVSNLFWLKCIVVNNLNIYDLFYSHGVFLERSALLYFINNYVKKCQGIGNKKNG